MSGYEDYSRTSAVYDETRVALGVEIILGCLASSRRPLSELVLLDAGCGTGTYSRALIAQVARIEALDLNQGMLEKARTKLKEEAAEQRIRFHRASISQVPLDDESVDGVMVNQVIHHLNDNATAGWPAVRDAVKELARVLAPGGVLIVNICSQQQITAGWWYLSLIPEAAERMRSRHVPIDVLQAIMSDCGFENRGTFVPLEGVMQGRHYFDGRGPLDARWRAGDSIWAMVEQATLESVKAKIQALDEAGALEAYVREHDAQRRHIGQFTFVCARKP